MTAFINKYAGRFAIVVTGILVVIIVSGEIHYNSLHCPNGTQKIRLYDGSAACAFGLQDPVE